MQSSFVSARGAVRSVAAALATTVVVLTGCSGGGDSTGPGPQLPGNPEPNPRFRQASFIMDVNTRTKAVKITAPAGPALDASLGSLGGQTQEIGGPSFSIVTGDVVELTTSNFTASAVGAFQPGKVRVTFDVNVTNRIPAINLITPTFPVPPAGTNGILLFPFSTTVTTTSGGTSVGGDGTEVIVELPNRGEVAASIDWDGSPFNFFNDDGCAAGSNDCYRFETYTQPLAGGATSEARTVGFDIDPTVGNFRARLIVAADIQAGGPPVFGTVSGAVTSNIGALSGVQLAVSGGFTGTTDGSGNYTIPNVNIGPRTVSISGGLPAGCTTPASQSVTVTNGGTHTVNFTVTCPTPSFTLSGVVTRTGGAPISGVSVTITPAGGSALAPVSTNGTGAYTASVPVGTGSGTFVLGNLPAGCTDPGSQTYSGAVTGGTVTRDVAVTCPVPGPNSLRGTWTISGTTATLLISTNITSGNLASIQGEFTPHPRLTYTGVGTTPAPILGNPGGGPAGSNPVFYQGFNGSAPATGNVNIVALNFSIGSGAAGSVPGGSINISEALDFSLNDVVPTFNNNISIDAVSLPAVP